MDGIDNGVMKTINLCPHLTTLINEMKQLGYYKQKYEDKLGKKAVFNRLNNGTVFVEHKAHDVIVIN